MRRLFKLSLYLFLIFIFWGSNSFSAKAQFFTNGDNPQKLKWYSLESPNFKIIYPQGLDSLAVEYAKSLEKYRIPVSLTSGFVPGQAIRSKMPVVLHAYNSISNGSVAWAPKRMDLFTIPSVYNSLAHPWIDQLAIHELRHVSQMQIGISNSCKPFKYIFGEMFNGLVIGLLGESSFLEGDAVVAETELSKAGRGREADFLNYYMVCFDQGDYRDWDRWRFGSQKYYVPDHYALGYLTFGGIRWYYNDNGYSKRYLDIASRKPYMLWVRETAVKDLGVKSVNKAFDAVVDSLSKVWSAAADKRAPYIPMEQISPTPRKYSDYSDLAIVGDSLYCIKEGHNDSRKLIWYDLRELSTDDNDDLLDYKDSSTDDEDDGVLDNEDLSKDDDSLDSEDLTIDDDLLDDEEVSDDNDKQQKSIKEHHKRHFAYNIGMLYHSPGYKKLFWSESTPHARWSMQNYSNIRYLDIDKKSAKRLTYRSYLYNPNPSYNEDYIATTEIHTNGRTSLSILDGKTGAKVTSFSIPDTLQLVETAWIKGTIYATAISKNGYGIYHLHTHKIENLVENFQHSHSDDLDLSQWEETLHPQNVKIKNFGTYNDILMFTSDRTGVNELYHFNPETKDLYQITSTRYGAAEFQYSEDGQWLYYSSQTIKGNLIFRTSTKDLIHRPSDWNERPQWIIADRLKEQADSLALKQYGTIDFLAVEDSKLDSLEISKKKRFRKFPDFFNFHSWAPFYFHATKLMDFSGERISDMISLGASAIFQNKLGTAYGGLGYSAHKDYDDKSQWRHSGHVFFRFSGWYPVIDAELNYGDRLARNYFINTYKNNNSSYNLGLYGRKNDRLSLDASVSVSIPWNLSSGGWFRRLQPKLKYSFTNDVYDSGFYHYENNGLDGFKGMPEFRYKKDGKIGYKHSLVTSLSFYNILSTTNSADFPRWGFGFDFGYIQQMNFSNIVSPAFYDHAFCYFPGITREQGLKLGFYHQMRANDKAFFCSGINILPRGVEDYQFQAHLSNYNKHIFKFTADYSIPVYIGDRAILGSGFFIKRLLITPFVDCTVANLVTPRSSQRIGVFSYGSEIALDMTNAFWLYFPMKLGINFSFNGVPNWKNLEQINSLGFDIKKFYIGPVFSVSF